MSTKYDTGDTTLTMEIPMTAHAYERYWQRLPGDAVEPDVAWRRGEDIQHPAVVRSLEKMAPTRVRVYNHSQEYLVVFVCDDKKDGVERVVTVYSGQTHDHGPTRAYLNSHGPHYTEGNR